MLKDALGDRMKTKYEDRSRMKLPRRTYTIIRIDGRAFHVFTRGFDKPFDSRLHTAMVHAAEHVCNDAQGCKLAFIQSDEASFLLTDFAEITTEAWFDSNVQKMASVAASIFTAHFNNHMGPGVTATFDARVFTIPDRTEVENYFIWRQQDAVRNSISAVAQSLYSMKELHGKNGQEKQDMIHAKGQNWDDCIEWQKRGSWITRQPFDTAVRDRWISDFAPIFTQERAQLSAQIPVYSS